MASDLDFDIDSVFETEDYLYFYESQLTEARTAEEVDFLIEALQLTTKHRVLDLACGFGRHANLLALRGFSVTGIDVMPGFIQKAKEDAMASNANNLSGGTATYLCQDMRALKVDDLFDAAYLMFNSFGYFDDDTNTEILKRCAESLQSGGRLCLDVLNREHRGTVPHPVLLTERGEDVMIDRWHVDRKIGRLFNDRILFRSGKRKDAPFSVRLYSQSEIQQLLASVGFRLLSFFGDYRFSKFHSGSRRVVCVAERI